MTGLWLVVSPSTFYSAIADFGARNTHDLRDISAFYLASAVVLAISTRAAVVARARAGARSGCSSRCTRSTTCSTSATPSPGWVGPFDLVALAAGALMIGWLYRAADRDDRERAR